MKIIPSSKFLFPSCLLATLASLPWITSVHAQSEGNFSTLNVGGRNTVTGLYASAMGFSNAVTGNFATAMGITNTASNTGSTAMGRETTASGYFSTAMGNETTASGTASTSMGYANTASGYAATAMGEFTWAGGDQAATAMGLFTQASGSATTAMGYSTTAISYAETVVGSFNTPISGNPQGWRPSDPAFEIGNGHPSVYETEVQVDLNGDGVIDQTYQVFLPETYSTALTVYKNGNMTLQGNLTLGGTITSAGSPVLTSASVGSYGYVSSSNFNATLAAATPPTSAAWTGAYVPRGNTAPVTGQTIGGYLALGTSTASGAYSTAAGLGVKASGSYSSATGSGTTTASGPYSAASGRNSMASGFYSTANGYASTASGPFSWANGYAAKAIGAYSAASGYNSTASGAYSTANGESVVASGSYSFTSGLGTSAKSTDEVVFGRYNLAPTPLAAVSAINGLDGLFRLGNGITTARSDAMTVLKNGQTTLTNKAWKSRDPLTVAATADPSAADTTDSDGNALVVDGHTILNGKVIISVPQGDISMGAYQ